MANNILLPNCKLVYFKSCAEAGMLSLLTLAKDYIHALLWRATLNKIISLREKEMERYESSHLFLMPTDVISLIFNFCISSGRT